MVTENVVKAVVVILGYAVAMYWMYLTIKLGVIAGFAEVLKRVSEDDSTKQQASEKIKPIEGETEEW